MSQTSNHYGRSRRDSGFTLIELIVVVGIITVLMALLMPTMQMAREGARRAVCQSNLQGAGAALMNYANNNDSALPQFYGPTNWLWDIPYGVRDAIDNGGMVRNTMYCPSGDFQNADDLWNYKSGYCVTGYFWMITRIGTQSNRYWYPTIYPPKQYHSNIRVTNGESVEIAADAVISVNGRFTGVWGGWEFPGRSNHLRYDKDVAAGGNILFLDGHVQWRDLSQMSIRCQPGNDEWF